MSADVVRIRARTIVASKLIPWEPGVPGIWFRYADGYEVSADATIRSPDISEAIRLLRPLDRDKLATMLDAARALNRS